MSSLAEAFRKSLQDKSHVKEYFLKKVTKEELKIMEDLPLSSSKFKRKTTFNEDLFVIKEVEIDLFSGLRLIRELLEKPNFYGALIFKSYVNFLKEYSYKRFYNVSELLMLRNAPFLYDNLKKYSKKKFKIYLYFYKDNLEKMYVDRGTLMGAGFYDTIEFETKLYLKENVKVEEVLPTDYKDFFKTYAKCLDTDYCKTFLHLKMLYLLKKIKFAVPVTVLEAGLVYPYYGLLIIDFKKISVAGPKFKLLYEGIQTSPNAQRGHITDEFCIRKNYDFANLYNFSDLVDGNFLHMYNNYNLIVSREVEISYVYALKKFMSLILDTLIKKTF